MVEGDIELLPSDHSVKYGQEVSWIFLFALPRQSQLNRTELLGKLFSHHILNNFTLTGLELV